MQPFIFRAPTRIICGENTAGSVVDIIKELGGKKTFILTDANLIQAKVLDPILAAFRDSDLPEPVVFSNVPSDSEISCVNEASAQARAANCDNILAVGGGSVIDTAKVVNICLTFGGHMLEYQGLNNLPSKLLPLICIPTTAGTGSEVSLIAVIKDAQAGHKLFFGSEFLAASAAILDPKLIVSLPPKLTAATGFDALTHDLEALAATATASPLSDSLCIESMRLLFRYLPQAIENGTDLKARAYTLVASTMAGLVVTNAGVGIIHALAHATGTKFSTHHGLTNAVYLLPGLNFNLSAANERYARAARTLCLSKSTDNTEAAKDLINTVQKLHVSCKLPSSLRELGIPPLSEGNLNELAELAETDPAIMFNPKIASKQDIISIIKGAY